MLIGVPKEIKNHEYRVGMVPASVRELVQHGHQVIVQTQAGSGIGCSDADYVAAGATVLATAEEVFAKAEMIVKVKEPQAVERARLREGQVLFTYLHLAPDLPQTEDLIKSGATCIAYETVTAANGGLPLLAPMSEVAGRMSIQAGATALQKANGGRGMLLGGVPGVEPAKVVILGGGVVGANAALMAVGLGAQVVVLDRNVDVLRRLVAQFGTRIETVFSSHDAVERHVLSADLVIGGVLVVGAAAPKLVSAEMVKRMKSGAAVVDVAIDQGGCIETARATTHKDPVYIVEGVVHYCVANMPGAVARTSTMALCNATLPYARKIAKNYKDFAAADKGFAAGINMVGGKITYKPVADSFNLPYSSIKS